MLLKKIPINVRDLLCASAQINNYRKAIEELVYNALDADSSSIAVRVHTQAYSFQIIDNGHGISRCDFDVLGQRHMTSKYVDLATLKSAPNKYGIRGESLSNIIEVSQSVKIISRPENTDETWTKIFYNGKQKNLKQSTTRPSKGTTVEIKGFLHNLRIKKNALDPLHELQEIKAFMEQISLLHNNISLSLRDDSKNEIIFQLHKKRDIYQTLYTLFSIDKTDVKELKVEKNQYKVTAFIGKTDKEIGKHWIFVNGVFVNDSSKLHKIINDNMNKKKKINRMTKLKSKNQNDCEEYNLINMQNPFYFILITCPHIDYDVSSIPKQNILEFRNWEQVTRLLEKLVSFYTGDIKLKEINKIENHIKEIKDIKTEVRNIINHFLASNSKKLRVSQMHNGVKGKLIKRKYKKLLKNPLITKNPSKISKKNTENHDIKIIPTIVTKIRPHKYTIDNQLFDKIIKQKRDNLNQQDALQKIHLPSKEIKSKIINKNRCKSKQINIKPSTGRNVSKIHDKIMPTKKSSQIKKNYKIETCNDFKKSRFLNDPIISRFANPTSSIKKRCKMIAEKADEILNNKIKRKQEVYINEKVEYSSFNKDNKNISIRKQIDEIIIHDYIPRPPKINELSNKSDFKSTYDLVQTILNSQQENMCQHNTHFSEMNMFACSPDRPKSILPKSVEDTPIISSLTFDSHHNDNIVNEIDKIKNIPFGNNKKWSRNVKFMNKQSKENFIAPIKRCSPKCIGEKNINTRNNKQFTEMIKKDAKATLLHNNYKQYAEYNIDFTKNDKSPVSYNHLKSNNETLSPYNISRYDDTTCTHQSPSNEIVNISDYSLNKINANTYAITKDDGVNFQTCRGTENLHIPRGTYSVHNSYDQYSDSQLHSNVISMEQDIFSQQRDNFDVILKSHSPGSKADKAIDINIEPLQGSKVEKVIDKDLDPLNICQAVLNSNDIFENEFEFSFNASNKLDDAQFNNNIIKDIDSKRANNYQQNGDFGELQEKLLHKSNMPDKSNIDVDSEHNSKIQNIIVKSNQISECVQDNLSNQLPDMKSNQNIKATEFSHFDLKNRHRFMPKGMSPIFENCNSKAACNYNLDKDYYEDNLYMNFVNDIQTNAEVFKRTIQNVKDVTSADIDKINSKLKKDDAILKFDGQSLKTAKVMGQVDDKFIAAIMKGKPNEKDELSEFLVLFDQHAVHERIRLEKNLSHYINNDQWNSVALDNVSIKVSKDVVLFLHNYKDKFTQLGLQWSIQNDRDIIITGIPEAILGKIPREVEKVIKSVKNLIAEEISIIQLQRGCVSLYPKAIMDLVFSEACRYAIKFGDKLTRNTCVELLNTLSECKTPFQCAHGRPVMAVLINIKRCVREYKVNLKKVFDFNQKVARGTCKLIKKF